MTVDIKYQRFGRLIALSKSEEKQAGNYKWFCVCDCGTFCSIVSSSLKRGSSKSCGCYRVDFGRKKATTHGDTIGRNITTEYNTWCNIKSRCFNPKNDSHYIYKDLEVPMEPSWINSYETFLTHVGKKPSPELSIERIDGTKGYVIGNVRWATAEDQSRNRTLIKMNTTGVMGVSLHNRGKKGGVENWCYIVEWKDNEKRFKKTFSIKKLGLLEAFYKAQACRKEAIESMRNQGIFYGKTHGVSRINNEKYKCARLTEN